MRFELRSNIPLTLVTPANKFARDPDTREWGTRCKGISSLSML